MFFKIYKEFFGLSKFQPDFYLIDNYKHIYEISGGSRLYNNYSQRVFYRSNFKINNFRKVLANLGGFTETINPNRAEKKYILIIKKDKWLSRWDFLFKKRDTQFIYSLCYIFIT
jgi:hypothetical protein